jgi:hypothetical protein
MVMNNEWVKIWEEFLFVYSEVLFSWLRRNTEIFSQVIQKLARIHTRHLSNTCLQCYNHNNLLDLNLYFIHT